MLRIVLGSYERLLYGSILAFHETGYFFTASKDAAVAIVRTSDWEPLKILKVRASSTKDTTAIQSISIHPTGKLLLSVSIDGYLRTWDTAKASCAYTYFLGANADSITLLYLKQGLSASKLPLERKSGKVQNKEPILIVAGDAKKVTSYNVATKQQFGPLATPHSTRIKDLSAVSFNGVNVLVTCSSDGGIYGWNLNAIENGRELMDALFSFDAKCRLTCCVATVQTGGKLKKTLEEEIAEMEADEDEEDEEEARQTIAAVSKKFVEVAKAKNVASRKAGARVVVQYEDESTSQETTESASSGPSASASSKKDNRKGAKSIVLNKDDKFAKKHIAKK
ncbi:UNVERIFIED_CONTAM: hypothetical protein HDU68_011644 [Siphonaria sp. JEL0065]|nr:hypothetical protein HDU68_011644 [Siphonaria sp. JEL0065]